MTYHDISWHSWPTAGWQRFPNMFQLSAQVRSWWQILWLVVFERSLRPSSRSSLPSSAVNAVFPCLWPKMVGTPRMCCLWIILGKDDKPWKTIGFWAPSCSDKPWQTHMLPRCRCLPGPWGKHVWHWESSNSGAPTSCHYTPGPHTSWP